METFKKYLPIIIIAIVGYFLLRMFSGSKGPTILPQTQITETPYTDPNAQFRLPAFEALANLGAAQISSERDIQLANIQKDISRGEQVNVANIARGEQVNQFNIAMQQLQNQLRQFDLLQILGLASEETELEKASIQSELTKFLQERQISFSTFLENSRLRQFELELGSREQDRQLQQAAIDQYFRQRSGGSTGSIINSISQALGGIFGGSGGGIFTPPTFPGFGGFF